MNESSIAATPLKLPFCFVTTCMGRLHHLQQTLPLLVAQPDASCVVVDYSCPNHCGDWVEANYSQVKVVRWLGATQFNPAHARNLGVAAVHADVIGLIDADVLVAPDFVRYALSHFDTSRYFLADPLTEDLVGTFICARAAFEAIGGYDEVCAGWGGEDLDLYDRLSFHGLERASFPARLVTAISHSDVERTAFHVIGNKYLSSDINQIYSRIKLDLMRLQRKQFSLQFRQTLHAKIAEACLSGRTSRIELNVMTGEVHNFTVKSSVGYVIAKK